jgi:hypothetical protein
MMASSVGNAQDEKIVKGEKDAQGRGETGSQPQ